MWNLHLEPHNKQWEEITVQTIYFKQKTGCELQHLKLKLLHWTLNVWCDFFVNKEESRKDYIRSNIHDMNFLLNH